MIHGDYGDRFVHDRIDGNTHVRCWGNARWCEKCQRWVEASGIVSTVLMAVGCPKCNALWDDSAKTKGEQQG